MDVPLPGIVSAILCQTTLVLGCGLLALFAVRRASGTLRSMIARATMAVVILALVISFAVLPTSKAVKELPYLSGAYPIVGAAEGKMPESSSVNKLMPPPQIAESAPEAVLELLIPMAPQIWLGGTILIFLWTITGLLRIQRIIRLAEPHKDTNAETVLTEVAGLYGIRPPRLLAGDVRGPILAGVLRPAIILPASGGMTLDENSLRALFAHELSHLRRRDCAWLLASGLFRALLWPQPLAWILARAQSDSAEDACDEAAVSVALGPREYARALVRLSDSFAARRMPTHTLGIVNQPSSLGRRIRRILASNPRRPTLSVMIACMAALAACGAVAAFQWPMPAVSQTPSSPSRDARPPYEPQPIPLAFEGLAEYTTSGFSNRAWLQYDHGKFRSEHLYRRSRGGQFLPAGMSLFDGTLSWDMDRVRNIARPSLSAIYSWLSEEARRTSDKAVQAKYGLIDIMAANLSRTYSSNGQLDFPYLFGTMEKWPYSAVGWGNVAGYRCRLYEYRHRPKQWHILSKDGRSLEGDFPTTKRVWVEPRTNFVLRWEHRDNRGTIGRHPPVTVSRRMLTFRRLSRISPDTFRLPPGVTAEIPEPFRNISLPSGVIRKEVAGIGMGGVTRPDIENKIRGEIVRQDRARKRLQLAENRGDDRRADVERMHIRHIDELLTQLRQRLNQKPPPLPRIRQ